MKIDKQELENLMPVKLSMFSQRKLHDVTTDVGSNILDCFNNVRVPQQDLNNRNAFSFLKSPQRDKVSGSVRWASLQI
jgi:hypothetical protein